MDAKLLRCFKGPGGNPAIRWDLSPARKRLTSKSTELWGRKTVVLNNIFAPEFGNDKLDMLFQKITQLTDTQFVILTAHPSRMCEYMERIWRLSTSGYPIYPKWLQYPAWLKLWKNVWFGITVKGFQDVDTVTSLTQTPSHRRFIVLEGDVQLAKEWMIPKCQRCGGRGWYSASFIKPTFVVCRECPAWDLPRFSPFLVESETRDLAGKCIQDKRERGGEIGWVIVPDFNHFSTESFNSVLYAQRQYGTAVYIPGMPQRLRQNPLW